MKARGCIFPHDGLIGLTFLSLMAISCPLPPPDPYVAVFSGGVAVMSRDDSFLMGEGDTGIGISFAYDYTMAVDETTNGQYALFVTDGGYAKSVYWSTNGWAACTAGGWTGSTTSSVAAMNDPLQPVAGVSWYEAVAYCNWLSATEGLTPAYDSTGRLDMKASGYSLPTEVEWEYAAAKGVKDEAERSFPWGDTWNSAKAVCSVPPASASVTERVGSRSPAGDTPQGLHDMSGNVMEWCSDNRQSDGSLVTTRNRYYFVADDAAARFTIHGACIFHDWADIFRCANRDGNVPALRDNAIGFRVVRR
jgi:gamma-glutamyl hercynylcysteine S-oxide synthase